MKNHIQKKREEFKEEAEEFLREISEEEQDDDAAAEKKQKEQEEKERVSKKVISKQAFRKAAKQLEAIFKDKKKSTQTLEVKDSEGEELPSVITIKKAPPSKLSQELRVEEFRNPTSEEEDKLFVHIDEPKKEQEKLVHEAFVSNNTHEKDWLEEIEAAKLKSQKKVQTVLLPGWGAWTGLDVEDAQGEVFQQYKDRETNVGDAVEVVNDNVIINKELDRKVAKYYVPKAPVTEGSKEQYEACMGHPLGPEWNTQVAHKRMIKPHINIRLGQVVPPLQHIKHLDKQAADSLLSIYDTKPVKSRHRRTKARL